jgi:transposase
VAKTVHGNKHLQSTLVECAWGATRKKDGFFKRKYESLIGRRGKKKALIAVGHKIIVASYHVIKYKTPYKEPELNNNPRRKNRQIRNYINKLKALGLEFDNVENQLKGRFFTEEQCASRT